MVSLIKLVIPRPSLSLFHRQLLKSPQWAIWLLLQQTEREREGGGVQGSDWTPVVTEQLCFSRCWWTHLQREEGGREGAINRPWNSSRVWRGRMKKGWRHCWMLCLVSQSWSAVPRMWVSREMSEKLGEKWELWKIIELRGGKQLQWQQWYSRMSIWKYKCLIWVENVQE